MSLSSIRKVMKGFQWFPRPGRSSLFTYSLQSCQSASLHKVSSNNKICWPSSRSFSLISITSKSFGYRQVQASPQITIRDGLRYSLGSALEEGSFDICGTAGVGPVKLNRPLYEIKKVFGITKNASGSQYLRSGMVLLKNFLSHDIQVQIVNKCRDLGMGCGGFYTPRYKSGGKLNLRMMCLGKNWDPQSYLYKNFRDFDGSVPPEIPEEFKEMVDDSLHVAHKFLYQIGRSANEIPNMSPDICLVNFYSENGKLGLHQDRDESKESIRKGLPVVSFSIGDSAKFLYTSDREREDKVMLDSGDVLIFGGLSRRVYHGVSHILPNTAPEPLIKETNLRTGRLNLTFRQL